MSPLWIMWCLKNYIDLIYMNNIKRQDLQRKLGEWGPLERVEGGRKGAEKKC